MGGAISHDSQMDSSLYPTGETNVAPAVEEPTARDAPPPNSKRAWSAPADSSTSGKRSRTDTGSPIEKSLDQEDDHDDHEGNDSESLTEYRSAPSDDEIEYQCHVQETDVYGHRTLSTRRLKGYACPVCPAGVGSFCGVDLETTWIHCVETHGATHDFKPLETQDGMLHLLVTVHASGNVAPNQVLSKRNPAVPSSNHFQQVFHTNVALPSRQYYRDVTFDKIGLAEWLFDQKETDTDQTWLGLVEDSALYDLTDVTPKEKHFFLLWNEFMRANPILSEVQLSTQTRAFVQECASTLIDHDLDGHLTAHLTNMWYEGVIGRHVFLDCLQLYNKLHDQRQR